MRDPLHAPAAFNYGERASGIYGIGGWVDPRTGLDVVEKRKISFPWRVSNPGRPTSKPVTIPAELFKVMMKFWKVKEVDNDGIRISRIRVYSLHNFIISLTSIWI
jgi:hypothetical protein